MKNFRIYFSITLISAFFTVSCENNEVELEKTVDINKIDQIVNNLNGTSNDLTDEQLITNYKSLSEYELDLLMVALTPKEDPAYEHDIEFRQKVHETAKELFNKPFNQLTYEEEEQIFDLVEANVLEVNPRNGRIEQAEPSWCVAYEYPLTLNHTWSPNVDWAFWSFCKLIENGVPQSDCDVRFVYYHTLNALDAFGSGNRKAKFSGGQTWHFYGLGRLNYYYGCNTNNWKALQGRK